ncbi:MAG TPA: NAD(P)/FAD-dependent oxidoreductase [Flavitalea sp.]|nr:NAD(P)/FAD-dependent oxidoreductase [Flavitalea sp.]
MTQKTLAVIGGGAAGFFCAVNAARLDPSLEVIVFEKTSKLLSKVRISGGGRCNVTHACFDIAEMSLKYPRGRNFIRKSFYHFFTSDTIEWFTSRGVPLKEEADGRMFPETDSSATIIECLLAEANHYKVSIRMNREVVRVEKKDAGWIVQFRNEERIYADVLCIACGGYAKDAQFEWLTSLGHNYESPVPSLFTFNIPGNNINSLMGISVAGIKVKIAGTKLEESGPVLITHWGLSGPVILRLSAWGAKELAKKDYRFLLQINWVPSLHQQSMQETLQQRRTDFPSHSLFEKNPFLLPARLWEYILQQSEIKPGTRWADLSSSGLNKLAKFLCNHELEVRGKTTYKEEFVTAGGIVLSEIDANTMRSKLHSNLFFAGEILDVDGITGGFNFQHAWTSGWVAANAIHKYMKSGSKT